MNAFLQYLLGECVLKRQWKSTTLKSVLVVCLLTSYADRSSGTKVLGIARGKYFKNIGDFCYTIPPNENGALLAETISSIPGHELLIVPKAVSDEISTDELNPTKPSIEICNKLKQDAKIREDLAKYSVLESSSAQENQFFELNLALEPDLDMQHVTAWIVRCDNESPMDVVYSVKFTNPGDFWMKHFSCQDQGLLQITLLVTLLSAIAMVGASTLYMRTGDSPENSVLPSAATVGAGMFLVGIGVYTVNLFFYASDGYGIEGLRTLAHVGMALTRCLTAFLLLSLAAKGPRGGFLDPNQQSLISLVGYAHCAAVFLVLVKETFSVDTLNIAAVFSSVWALPFHIFCAVAAAIVGISGVLNAESAIDRIHRRFFLRITLLGPFYFCSPLISSWFFPGSPILQAALILYVQFAAIFIIQRQYCVKKLSKVLQLSAISPTLGAVSHSYAEI